MRRLILLIILLNVMAATAVAQTQQGYVKTRGKLAADGKSVVPGVRLSNALVTIENRSPVKSGADGEFSFTLPAGTNRYRLLNAELKGYTLADPDAVRQTHTFSKDVPLIVVLEDMKQREADLEAARKSVRNVMKREIRKKQDELDSLRDAHAITQAKYDSLVRDFWEYRQSSEKLVNEMAERYVSTDYDRLDDFNRQVQAYIESGQLTKADSMIRSKGSLEERFNRVKQYESTNAQREAEIQQEQEVLDKSRQYTQKEKEDLANDLYRQHLIFLQQPMMQDSALYCLKLRANLDTTNIDWVWEYADLSYDQRAFIEAEKYYLICLRFSKKQNHVEMIAAMQNNLGNLYRELHDYISCEKYLKQSLNNKEKLFSDNPDGYRAYLASTLNNMGWLYSDLHDYASSESYYRQALMHTERLYTDYPDVYCSDLASIQNNLGNLFRSMHDYDSSEKYLKLALKQYERLFASDSNTYRSELSMTQHNLAALYRDIGDYTNSERYYKQALEHKKILFANNPDAFRADYASTLNNLGIVYVNLHDYINAEKYLKQALELRKELAATNPEAYRINLSETLGSLGTMFYELHKYDSSEMYCMQALNHLEILYDANPDAYRYRLAMEQQLIGNLFLYSDMHDYDNSEKYLLQALENMKILFSDDPDGYRADLASTQSLLGVLYFVQNDYVRSEKYFRQAMEHYEKLFDSRPNVYGESLGTTYGILISLFEETEQVDKYDTCLSKALPLYRMLYSTTPSNDNYKEELIELQNRAVWRMMINEETDEAIELARKNYELDKTNEETKYYLAECLNNKAIQYAYESNYIRAINIINEAIGLAPQVADLYDSKGRILLMQGKDQEALKMWKKVLELNPKFLDEYPEGTRLSNGLKAKGLIK